VDVRIGGLNKPRRWPSIAQSHYILRGSAEANARERHGANADLDWLAAGIHLASAAGRVADLGRRVIRSNASNVHAIDKLTSGRTISMLLNDVPTQLAS